MKSALKLISVNLSTVILENEKDLMPGLRKKVRSASSGAAADIAIVICKKAEKVTRTNHQALL
jgi:hypothetical protein